LKNKKILTSKAIGPRQCRTPKTRGLAWQDWSNRKVQALKALEMRIDMGIQYLDTVSDQGQQGIGIPTPAQ
jgi:hypothetical protein